MATMSTPLLSTPKPVPSQHPSPPNPHQQPITIPSDLPSRQWYLLTLPAWLTTLYALLFLTRLIPSDPQVVARILGSPIGATHISASLIAMFIGPLQFLPSIRKNKITLHRVLGWVYTLAVVVGGASAFWVSFQSAAYPWGRVGFAALALAWLETLRRGVGRAVKGDVKGHERWMRRNFALTYAAVELRWMLPLLLAVGGLEMKLALSIVAWSCWVPNLVVVEVFIP